MMRDDNRRLSLEEPEYYTLCYKHKNATHYLFIYLFTCLLPCLFDTFCPSLWVLLGIDNIGCYINKGSVIFYVIRQLTDTFGKEQEQKKNKEGTLYRGN